MTASTPSVARGQTATPTTITIPQSQGLSTGVKKGIGVTVAFVQWNLDIRIPKLSPKTKDIPRYPYNEVWQAAKLIPAGPADVSLY
jgi:hypothetical protein